ncbi:MAG: DUF4214 domain-containing protein [Pyrinomonadaceae bacterium]
MMADGDGDEDVKGRLNWFMFQRTYPFDSIPVDARRKAWEGRPGKEKGRDGLESAQSLWQPIGPKATVSLFFSNYGYNSGRINTIAISPADPNLILVGASTGGIWHSTDGGANFTPVSDNQVDLAVGSIAFSKSNPSIVYAGMGDAQTGRYMGTGFLRSTDGGQTWTRVDVSGLPLFPLATNKVEVDPNDSNRVYLSLYGYVNNTTGGNYIGGFYVSTNGGVNWTRTLYGDSYDVVINPANRQTLYIGMDNLVINGSIQTGGGLHKSTDSGITWNQIYSAPAGGVDNIKVAVSPADSQRIYVYSGNGVSTNLAVSTNGGASWTEKSTTSLDKGQFWYNCYIYADPTNADTVYIGARDVFKSTNGGNTWTNLTHNYSGNSFQPRSANAHPDQHSLAFYPGNSNVIYIGNDGGLYKTTNGGSTFQSLNDTLSLTQFTSIARHPTNPLISYGGTQDNGTQRRSVATPDQWQDFAGGDGGNTVIDPVNPGNVVTTVYYGLASSWANNGSTYLGGTSNETFGEPTIGYARIGFYPPLVGNGVNSTLYFGTYRLFVNTNPSLNMSAWTAPGGTTDLTKGGSDVLNAIGVGRSNHNYIYTGSFQGRAMVSTDGGVNWTDITAGLPNRSISDIRVDAGNPSIAYIAFSGFASGHIFKTTNTGASWTDVSGNLPNIPVNAIFIDQNNASIVYLGTDIGVFRSTTGGTSWSSFNDGLPPVIVTGFTANANGQIQIATYGRGAYEMSGVSSDDFSVTTDSSTRNVSPGGTATYTIRTATTSGNAQNVNLSLSGMPSGAASTFNPTSVTSGGTSTLTIFVGSGAPAGNYQMSVNGSGSQSHSTNITMSICGYTLSSTRQSFSSSGGGATVNVNSTGACGWSVSNNAPWISVFSSGQDGPGNGKFTFSVAANPASIQRVGTLTVGGQTVIVTQSPGPAPAPNQIDDARNFVTQHYLDFLNRAPDQGGLDYWSYQITQCGIDSACIHNKRIDVSAAYFIELEFQETGSYVYRLYKASLGQQPKFAEFMPDRETLHAGSTLESDKQALADNFVQRSAFQALYPQTMTNVDFVNRLYDTAGLVPYTVERAGHIAAMTAGKTRAQVLREVIEIQAFRDREYNPSFVMMQYYGYLRRDYDQGGYDFWLNVLNNKEPGNFRGMVCSFITSAEYQLRFGAGVTRSNQDCQ